MAIKATEIIQVATETVRGTLPDPATWVQHEYLGEMSGIQHSRSGFEGKFPSAFPQMSRVIKTGHRLGGPIVLPMFAATAEAIINMGLTRTSGVLNSYTIQKQKAGAIEEVRYLGCVVETLTIRGEPGDDPVLVTLDIQALEETKGSYSISAGTYPAGVPLMGHKTEISVNSVNITQWSSFEITIANTLFVGPSKPTGWPQRIRDGYRRVGVVIDHLYDEDDWADILRANTVVPIVIAMKNGTGSVHATATMAEAQVMEAPEQASDPDSEVTQPLTAVCQKPAATDEIVMTYATS